MRAGEFEGVTLLAAAVLLCAMAPGCITSFAQHPAKGTDHLGSTNAVLDGAGAVEYEQRYLPHGQPRLDASGNPIDFGYTSQRESETGLMDYREAPRSVAERQRPLV